MRTPGFTAALGLLGILTLASPTGCSRQEQQRPRDSAPDSGAATASVPDASAPALGLSRATVVPEPSTPGRAVLAFALDLHRAWRADESRRGTTAALSPLSLAGGLALVHVGARGETREELGRALHLSALVAARDVLTLEARGSTGFEISRGQRVFVDPRVAIESAYREEVNGAVASLDFRNPEAARGGINRWVEGVTSRRIPAFLPPGAVDERTRLVLVDALAASARWASPFDPSRTQPRPFTALDGTVEILPLMVVESAQRFARTASYEAIDVACADAEHALLILAPLPGHFDELDGALDLARLDEIVRSLEPGRVALSLPRFHADLDATSLKPELRLLGVDRAFDERANLEGLTRTAGAELHVADVLHAARFDVDEKGARAAAASGAVVGLPAPMTTITIDRPFLFFLRNVRTGAPVVMGRFMGNAKR